MYCSIYVHFHTKINCHILKSKFHAEWTENTFCLTFFECTTFYSVNYTSPTNTISIACATSRRVLPTFSLSCLSSKSRQMIMKCCAVPNPFLVQSHVYCCGVSFTWLRRCQSQLFFHLGYLQK